MKGGEEMQVLCSEEQFEREFFVERSIKKSERGELLLLRRRADGRRCVLRTFSGKGDVYRRLQTVSSPHLPRIEQLREADGVVSVLEEYIIGDPLSFLMAEGPLSEEDALAVSRQLCAALRELHALGIIHRDIKPSNIILRGDEAVLVDFDASRAYEADKKEDTVVLGTIGYAAPEQYGFSQTDARADIYSLGVLMNVMLTGEHPAKRLADSPLRPLIDRCIEVNTEKRFSSAEELLEALDRVSRPKHRLWPWLLAALVLLGLAALALSSLCRDRSGVTVLDEMLPLAEKTELESVELWTGEALSTAPRFLYDADGDGEAEEYLFGVGSLNHYSEEPILNEENYVSADQRPGESMAPMVWRRTETGYTYAEDMAERLTDCRVSFWRVGEDGGTAPEVYETRDTLFGIWKGALCIRYETESTGTWLWQASAVLNGKTLTATSLCSIAAIDDSGIVVEDQMFRYMVGKENSVEDWGSGVIGTAPRFSFDLYGDGPMEDYVFGLGCLSGDTSAPVTEETLHADGTGTECMAPMVWRRMENGELVLAEELLPLIEDASVSFWRADGRGLAPKLLPQEALPASAWEGGLGIVYSADNAGTWLWQGSIVLNGKRLTATAVTRIAAGN